jgi:hypothetical protein
MQQTNAPVKIANPAMSDSPDKTKHNTARFL